MNDIEAKYSTAEATSAILEQSQQEEKISLKKLIQFDLAEAQTVADQIYHELKGKYMTDKATIEPIDLLIFLEEAT